MLRICRFKIGKSFALKLVVTLLFSLTLFIIRTHKRNNNNNNQTEFVDNVNHVKTSSSCPIIDSNAKSVTYSIDGDSYPKRVLDIYNKSINFECLNKHKTNKIILYWKSIFAPNEFVFGLGEKPFVDFGCPVTKCELTNNRSRINEADLVLVHGFEMSSDDFKKHHHRPDFQRWVFLSYEPPMLALPDHITVPKEYDEGFFNLTATYLVETDYISLFEVEPRFVWGLNKSFDQNFDFSKTKKNLVAATITNCRDNSQRMEYIFELKKHISVDIYGKCGKPCPTRYKDSQVEALCHDIIGNEYKFFLAFENSVRTHICSHNTNVIRERS